MNKNSNELDGVMKPGVYLKMNGDLVVLEYFDHWEFLEKCEYLGPL
jgi:hypothetical protein